MSLLNDGEAAGAGSGMGVGLGMDVEPAEDVDLVGVVPAEDVGYCWGSDEMRNH